MEDFCFEQPVINIYRDYGDALVMTNDFALSLMECLNDEYLCESQLLNGADAGTMCSFIEQSVYLTVNSGTMRQFFREFDVDYTIGVERIGNMAVPRESDEYQSLLMIVSRKSDGREFAQIVEMDSFGDYALIESDDDSLPEHYHHHLFNIDFKHETCFVFEPIEIGHQGLSYTFITP